MSNFINKADYGQSISENILDQVTKFDDNKLAVAEYSAIELISGYLNNRYDVAAIFEATGSDRNPVILMHAVNIALCNLHAQINPRKVPQHRLDAYNRAIEWLTLVSELKINPPSLPIIVDDRSRDYIKFGGNTKRANNLYE